MKPSRREFMTLAGAAVAAPLLPAAPAVGAPVAVTEIAAPLMAYVVGTPGEYDAQAIWATSPRAAYEEWAHDHKGILCADGACEICENYDSPDGPLKHACSCDHNEYVTRVKVWDELDHEPTPGEWIDVGIGHICQRCDWETSADDAYNISGEAVCYECMTLADWKIASPERYQEELEELLDEEYGPATEPQE
jgi:hypothetical protein